MSDQPLFHPFAPVYDGEARILILGTFPSVRSRAEGFYYGHPQNRFWRVLAALYDHPVPLTVPEKRSLLLSRRIALWDVLSSCEITGSSDAAIRAARPNDIPWLLSQTQITRVFANGQTAAALYRKHFSSIDLPLTALPSTSPANAAFTMDRLLVSWKEILSDNRL